MRTTITPITRGTMIITISVEAVFFCVVSFEGVVTPVNIHIQISIMLMKKIAGAVVTVNVHVNE